MMPDTSGERTVPGRVDVVGAAEPGYGVTVNGQNASRQGQYFSSSMDVTNTAAPVWQFVSVQSGAQQKQGHVYVPRTPETFTYDFDGNLTTDGRWSYTWDGENRLTGMESVAAVTDLAARKKLTFGYDSQGRRIWKRVQSWTGSAYETPGTRTWFLYDGWNLVAEQTDAGAVVRSYLWGPDLSGTFQGAGGIGGLIAVNMATLTRQNTHFALSDGNGNIVGLLNTETGVGTADYEYGPFGELLRRTGPAAENNPFQFSSKYCDPESGLLYYGYRYYCPAIGRWISRDPMQEAGTINLYVCAENSTPNRFDPDGRVSLDVYFKVAMNPGSSGIMVEFPPSRPPKGGRRQPRESNG